MNYRKTPDDFGDGPEFVMESSVYCPYCGSEQEMCDMPANWGWGDSIELECESCGRAFNAQYDISYSTQQIEDKS
jgi:transposase-like protein